MKEKSDESVNPSKIKRSRDSLSEPLLDLRVPEFTRLRDGKCRAFASRGKHENFTATSVGIKPSIDFPSVFPSRRTSTVDKGAFPLIFHEDPYADTDFWSRIFQTAGSSSSDPGLVRVCASMMRVCSKFPMDEATRIEVAHSSCYK